MYTRLRKTTARVDCVGDLRGVRAVLRISARVSAVLSSPPSPGVAVDIEIARRGGRDDRWMRADALEPLAEARVVWLLEATVLREHIGASEEPAEPVRTMPTRRDARSNQRVGPAEIAALAPETERRLGSTADSALGALRLLEHADERHQRADPLLASFRLVLRRLRLDRTSQRMQLSLDAR